MSIRLAGKKLLYKSRLFFPCREAFQYIFDRERLKTRRERQDFYKKFVKKGDLVFDIGANIGTYSETFTDIGAKVISVEPDPICWDSLERLASLRKGRVTIYGCAIGDSSGRVDFHLSRTSVGSTISPPGYPLLQGHKERGTIKVNILTLDELSSIYGVPDFVKIDTEGYDYHVVKGMSFRPSALSFEYLLHYPIAAENCLRLLRRDYVFSYTRGTKMSLRSNWMSSDQMSNELALLKDEPSYGDVIARLRN